MIGGGAQCRHVKKHRRGKQCEIVATEARERLETIAKPAWSGEHTEEAKLKMSISRKGKPSKLKGTRLTEETKKKIREKAIERYKDPVYAKRMAESRRGKPNKNKGKTGIYRDESLSKMSNSAKKRYAREGRLVEIDGIYYTRTEIAEIASMTRVGIYQRIKSGVTGADLLKPRAKNRGRGTTAKKREYTQ